MQTALDVSDPESPTGQLVIRQPDNPAVIVADGHGIRIVVRRSHLVIEDGWSQARRTRTIPRVPRDVARLVILSDTGYVSLEALRWCADLGISVTQLDRTGRIVMSSPGLAGDARLRAAQVLAEGTDTGTAIVRSLISHKLAGQSALVATVFGNVKSAASIADHASRVRDSTSLDAILALEGSAAHLYWRAWKHNVFVPFAPGDLPLVPAHWHQFTARASMRNPLSQGKNATDPVNALLNYAYALCESEARYACHVIGLDPALGFGHGAYEGNDILAFDLMEVLRPLADKAVLSLLDTGHGVPYGRDGKPAYFDVLWFMESREGICRLVAPLTHRLNELVPAAVAKTAGIHAENISRALASVSRHKLRTTSYASVARPARLHSVKATPKTKLASDLVPGDVLTDAAWEAVQPFIPPEPVVRRHKTPRADNRAVLAGILCHEVMGVGWRSIPPTFGVSWNTCRRRLLEWEQSGAWPAIMAAARAGQRGPS